MKLVEKLVYIVVNMRVLHVFGIYLVHLARSQNTGTPCSTTLTLDDYNNPTIITSPGYPVKYPSYTNCWWRLKARDATKIVVMETIDSMIHFSKNCREDYVMNYDRGYIFGDFDHKWCGNRRTFEKSTGQYMMLVLTSDYREETRGFQMKAYQANSSGPCNQEFQAEASEQFFESPGYPLGYYPNLQCVYEIQAPEGERVEIHFEDTDIEASPGCVNDNIRVADYSSNNEMNQTSFCGTQKLTFQSSQRTMRITLTTNELKEGKGFRLKYKTIPRDQCILTLTASDEYSHLMSPGYSSGYYSNLNCEWTVVPPTSDPTRLIELSTESMDVQGTYPQCSTDTVTVADYNGTALGTICGNQQPTYNSTGPSMTVTFTTDASIENTGFILRYRLVPEAKAAISCGGTITARPANQTLQSPNYPVAPLENITCVWTITAESEDSSVLLSLTDMNIEMESQCRYDSLKIYNGKATDLTSMMANWCGQSSGTYIQSTGHEMTVVFESDDSKNLRGFTAQVSSTKVALPACGYTLPARSTPSQLSTPRSPYIYPLNMTCHYLIVADDPGLQIRVDALFSNMPQRTGACTQDYVKVYDGKTIKSPDLPSINTKNIPWCGDDLPTFISGGQYMLLVFRSDNLQSIFRNGFTLLYTQGNYTSIYQPGCGGDIYATDTPMYITHPTTHFDEDMVCKWRIHANTSGHMVRVIVNADLQQPNSHQICNRDSLAVYEGDKQDVSMTITNMCGEMSQYLQSSSDMVTVTFFTDHSKSDAKFSLKYFQTTEPLPCEFEFPVKWTHTTTLESEANYQPNIECTWLLRRGSGKVQVILSEHTNQYQQWDCTQQYVNVYDGNTEAAPQIGQYCGDKPITVTGSADYVLVRLMTGPAPVGKPFKIEYYTVTTPCSNEQLYPAMTPRYLTSPNYPFNYINDVTCSWNILVDRGPHLVVEIQVLFADLQYSPKCIMDYVELYDDLWQNKVQLGLFCGNETSVYVSTKDRVNVRFHTDERGVGRGFRLSYKAVPAPTTQPTTSESSSSSNSALIGAIVGGVIGVLAFIVLIIVIVVCVVRQYTYPIPKLVDTPQIVYSTEQSSASVQYQSQRPYPTQSLPRPSQEYNEAYDGTIPASASASAYSEYANISTSQGNAQESPDSKYDNPSSSSGNPYGYAGHGRQYESENSTRNRGEASQGQQVRRGMPPPPSYESVVGGGGGSFVQGNTFYLAKPEYS